MVWRACEVHQTHPGECAPLPNHQHGNLQSCFFFALGPFGVWFKSFGVWFKSFGVWFKSLWSDILGTLQGHTGQPPKWTSNINERGSENQQKWMVKQSQSRQRKQSKPQKAKLKQDTPTQSPPRNLQPLTNRAQLSTVVTLYVIALHAGVELPKRGR